MKMRKKNKLLIFIGLELIFCVVNILLIKLCGRVFVWKEVWPIFAISSGIALFLSSLIVSKKITPNFLVPSGFLVVLGVFFMLFSMHIVPITFVEFVKRWWPCVPVLAIGILLGMFVFNKKTTPK